MSGEARATGPAEPGPAAAGVPSGRESVVVRPSAEGSFRAVLRNGPFLRLWLAQAISHTANNTVNFALLLQIRDIVDTNQIAQANTVISLVILAFSLPSVIFGPLAGVVADRMNRRLVMAVVNAARAVAVVLFLFIQAGWPVPAVLGSYYGVTFLFGAVGQFFPPAQGAVIPSLVSRRELISANALFNLTFTASQLLGFAVVGPLLAKIVGIEAIFVITGGLFIACAAMVMTLPDMPAPPMPIGIDAHPMRRLVADVREGLVFILRDKMLMKAIAYLTLSATTFLMVAALGPDFMASVIGLSTEDIGYIVAPAGIGVGLGVALVPRLLRRFAREDVIDWAIIGAGVALILMATSRMLLGLIMPATEIPVVLEIAVVGFFAAVLGACDASIIVPSQTILQERSHESIRARVYATFFTISNTVAFIPIFFAAAAADVFGVVGVLVVVAVLLVVVGIVSLARRRAADSARWGRIRTRHREGPEALSVEQAASLERVDDREL
ncbi:MAG: MFS transporter [Chloroflexota bacterium]|nr:MFS transporter [Chloroflexota bacterium]